MPKSIKIGGRVYVDEPNMSDLTLLMSVEDLINIAMGSPKINTINYKMLQTVLHILARHMRLLDKKVEVNIPDDGNALTEEKLAKYLASTARETARRSAKSEKLTLKKETESFKDKERAERSKLEVEQKAEKLKTAEEKEKNKKMTPEEKKKYVERKEREEKELQGMSLQEKEKYVTEKEEREMAKMTPEKKKKYLEEKELQKISSEEKDKYLKEKEEREMTKMSSKEKDEYHKEKEAMTKMTAKEKEKYLKEKEERKVAKMSPEEKEEYFTRKEEREMAKMSAKEEEKYLKDQEERKVAKMSPEKKEEYIKEKEEREMAQMSPKEKEEYLKETEIISKMSPKEKEEYFNDKKHREMTKMSPKEKEEYYLIEKEIMSKMSPKEKEKYLKEKEETEVVNMSSKEKEKYLKEKEETEMVNMSSKEKEKYLKEKEVRETAKMSSKEKEKYQKQQEEREKSYRMESSGPRRRGSGVDIVTQTEFRLLEEVVKELKNKAGPMPMPKLPDSKKLKKDLVTGRASLTDTMTAMQVSARMQAAEQAVGRLAKMLTQLAAAGVLPKEFALNVEDVNGDMNKSMGIDPMSTTVDPSSGATFASRTSVYHGQVYRGPVWQDQMEDTLMMMKDDLIAKIQTMTQQATITAEVASGTAKAVVDNFDAVLKMKNKINALYSLTTDYTSQLTGIDFGFTTQMQGLNEQIAMLKEDLKASLVQLRLPNRHQESPVIMDLRDRYKSVAMDLDETLTVHQDQAETQRQLGNDLHSLMEIVEMLQEQKADRDEMLDGLRDKADNSRMDGLVSMKRFESIRMDIDVKLRACYRKFSKQKAILMIALRDLSETQNSKAEVTDLLIMKENVKDDLLSIQNALEELAIRLAEPKAAILLRLLSKDSRSRPCKVEALMIPMGPASFQPHQLSELRPLPKEEPCVPKLARSHASIDVKEHICKRWAGGSHTLLCVNTPRETAVPPPPPALSRRYIACGTDGKPYKMTKDLLPCIECNKQQAPQQQRRKHDIPKAYRDGGEDNMKLTTKMQGSVCDCLPAIRI